MNILDMGGVGGMGGYTEFGTTLGPLTAPVTEIWCAYNSDGSAFCIFPTEVEALRHALAYTMSGVKKVTWGDLCEQVSAA